ncbi:GrpB family protein [Albibacterium sp.]|uniref:GrpB family protein n=1 Tax=Albibacterium sp. TaxID=2952885 RepID=UPI002B8C3B81|nr:GrpB family protein [Albibacterium sp.]HUH18617.1 GrpB family protein [Albibacterium sp.]
MEKRITDLTKDEIAKLFPVKLSSHTSQWKGIYEKERDLILSVLNDVILRIEHFGSTSVPNIIAKDTIDILIEISDENNFNSEIVEKFKTINYDYILQNEGSSQHMVFVKGYSPTGEKGQTFHVHMGPKNHQIWDRILFRDYLRERIEIAQQYEILKIKLSETHKYDRVGYRIAKTKFVQKVTEEAKQYYQ